MYFLNNLVQTNTFNNMNSPGLTPHFYLDTQPDDYNSDSEIFSDNQDDICFEDNGNKRDNYESENVFGILESSSSSSHIQNNANKVENTEDEDVHNISNWADFNVDYDTNILLGNELEIMKNNMSSSNIYLKEMYQIYLSTCFAYIGSQFTKEENSMPLIRIYILCFQKFSDIQPHNYFTFVNCPLKLFGYLGDAKYGYMPLNMMKYFDKWYYQPENLNTSRKKL